MHLIKELQNYEAKIDRTKQRNKSIQNIEDFIIINRTTRPKKKVST